VGTGFPKDHAQTSSNTIVPLNRSGSNFMMPDFGLIPLKR
jgi:hypothetical protein